MAARADGDETMTDAVPSATGETTTPSAAATTAAVAEADGADARADDDSSEGARTESQRIRVLPGSTDTAASFEFTAEDHTLGNALRYMIMKNPKVEFCGYTIPHPSEAKMNLRIQTWDEENVYDVLEKGLDDVVDMCNVVSEKFVAARDEFDARGGA